MEKNLLEANSKNTEDNTEAKFSYYKCPIKNTKPTKDIGLADVVKAIKWNKTKEKTLQLRALDNDDEAREYKSFHFDYVTFSGTFTQRGVKCLTNYSGLMVLDLDDVDVEDAKHKLLNQTLFDIALMFTSPSGNGVKVVVPSTTLEEHEQVFGMYKRCLKEEFDLTVDESGKDVSRACFIAYDKDVYMNENYVWRKMEEYWVDTQTTLLKPEVMPYTLLPSADNYEGLSPFDDYSSRGDVVSLLQLHGWKINESASDSINIRFTRPGKKGGNSADLRRSDKILYVFTNGTAFEPNKAYTPTSVFTLLTYGSLSTDAYNKAALKLLEMGYGEASTPLPRTNHALNNSKKSNVYNFYTSSFTMSASHLANYFKQAGFMRISEEGNDTITIIKNENKILNPFNHKTDTIAYLKQNINHPEKREHLENLLVSKKNLIQNSWELMVPRMFADIFV